MGTDHPRCIATLDNLGYSHSKNKDYMAALSVSFFLLLYLIMFLVPSLSQRTNCSTHFFSPSVTRKCKLLKFLITIFSPKIAAIPCENKT